MPVYPGMTCRSMSPVIIYHMGYQSGGTQQKVGSLSGIISNPPIRLNLIGKT